MLVVEIREDLKSRYPRILPGLYKLGEEVTEGICICECNGKHEGVVEVTSNTAIKFFEYRLHSQSSVHEGFIEYALPNTRFTGLWRLIVCDEAGKYKILSILFKFSLMNEYTHLAEIFSINKTILLHGPPGTGKSTLGRALAQKFAIRSATNFTLRELKCSQIFSKFYGESLHILSGIFNATSNTRFIVDEVESLLSERSLLFRRNEPNDSLRLINTFLTILDQRNAIFIFTSNFIDQLDQAFIDRCDLIKKMSCPAVSAIYTMMVAILNKLMHVGLLTQYEFVEYKRVLKPQGSADDLNCKLFSIAERSIGMSGRKIKKNIFEALGMGMMTVEDLLVQISEIVSSCTDLKL